MRNLSFYLCVGAFAVVMVLCLWVTILAVIDCGWVSLLWGRNVVWAYWLGQC